MIKRLLALTCLGWATSQHAAALEINFGSISGSWNNEVSVGARIRMQSQSYDLLGKLNVPGQQDLCAEDDCVSYSGDPAPNQRLVDAQGAFVGALGDDGNLNYDQYDVVAATTTWITDLKLNWGNLFFRGRVLGLLDPVNADFDETHTDTRYQPAQTQRPDAVESDLGRRADILDGYLSYAFELGNNLGTFNVGYLQVPWGESNFVQINSLNEVNPPSSVLLHTPGVEIGELFQAVEAATLEMSLGANWGIQLIYQFGWDPVEPDPHGAFYSFSDVPGGANFALVGLGAFSEDPDRQYEPVGEVALISSSTRTATVLPDNVGYPGDTPQYGGSLKYYADWLNGGTQLSLFFLNYHSRLPYLSAIGAQESCARQSANFAEALVDCRGFNGSINPLPTGLEPLPVDSLTLFLDYPEDIQMYGISFNTNIGDWSLAGEFSYRPELPVQVDFTDIFFTALQPAFPEQDIPIGIDGLSAGTIPSANHALPSYLASYRNTRIETGQYIPGYERLPVEQYGLTGIRIFGPGNWLNADQLIFLVEFGATHIRDFPDTSVLQFEAAFPNDTHRSPGADGTGLGGEPDTARFTPTQQTSNFPTSWSYGVRTALLPAYNGAWLGWNFKPTVLWFWDLEGIAPFPAQNFVEDRHEILAGMEVDFSQSWSGTVAYQWFTGAGANNTLRDRDNLALSLSYAF